MHILTQGLTGSRPDIFKKNFHVLNRRSVIEDTASQREFAAEQRVGQIAASSPLQVDKDAFVKDVEITRVPNRPITEAEDRKANRREQLKILRLPHQLAEM